MKHLIYIFAGLICCLITLPQVGASPLENKKQRFRITVLNTGGEPQQGIILKVAGYSSEYISNEQGLIDFEQSIDNNYVRTANFYFPTDKNRTIQILATGRSSTRYNHPHRPSRRIWHASSKAVRLYW